LWAWILASKPAICYYAKIAFLIFLVSLILSFNYLLQSRLKLTALLAGAIALVIALQGAVVLRQLVGAAIAGHRSTTATNRYLPC
jgi:predicted membrane-bound spermidine synthase